MCGNAGPIPPPPRPPAGWLVGRLDLLKLGAQPPGKQQVATGSKQRQVSWTHIKTSGQNGFWIKKGSWQEVLSPLWNLDEASPLACQGHPGWVRAWPFTCCQPLPPVPQVSMWGEDASVGNDRKLS